MRKLVICSGVLIACVGLAYLLKPRQPAGPHLPIPNGYDDFVKATQQASSRYSSPGTREAELRETINANRAALELVRAGLAKLCVVPLNSPAGTAAYSAQHLPLIARFRTLAFALGAQGELAEREGKTNDAARAYMDGIRFGQEACRGGLGVDRLVGIAIEAIALKPLTNILPNVDAPTCRDIARLIEAMEANREPIADTWKHERTWCLHGGTLRERFTYVIGSVVQWKTVRAIRNNADAKLLDIQKRERRVMLQAAARAYQMEHGQGPSRMEDLVPGYLKSVPSDPRTGQMLPLHGGALASKSADSQPR